MTRKAATAELVLERVERLIAQVNETARTTRDRPRSGKTAPIPGEALLAPEVRRHRGDVFTAETLKLNARGHVSGRTRHDHVQSQLTRMFRRRQITARQFAAGEQLAETFEAGIISVRSQLGSDNAIGAGRDQAVAMVAKGALAAEARRRIDAAVIAIGALAELVLWVAVSGRPAAEWAGASSCRPASGADMLRLGLDTLADHYDLPEVDGSRAGSR